MNNMNQKEVSSGKADHITLEKKEQLIPTYKPHPPIDLPMFFEKKPYQGATGRLYPIPFTDSLSEQKSDEPYQTIVLENEFLSVVVLPELGGKIYRAYDKVGKYDFMYYNSVIKPAMIGLAGPWISGGIEFNWPQHHRPTTFSCMDSYLESSLSGEKTAWVGEVEPLNRNKGMAGISLVPGKSYIKVKVQLYNRTPFRQPFMWWANLAVPVNENYRINFPPDVEYVNDHDRRAVIGWPIAKGIYNTARPYDFGEGTNLSDYNAIKVNSSYLVSEGQSDMDFVSGYDHGKQRGIVAYVDHSIAPGKKLFHWGVTDFGKMWCSNLTDSDGPYVELMTGAYTDNQPDFAWILPYETKTFEQYWYPIQDIGDVKNANLNAAVNLEQRGQDLFLGLQTTGTFPESKIRLFHQGHLVWEEIRNLSPDSPFVQTLPMEACWKIADLLIECTDNTGSPLISYQQPVRGIKKPITPRKPAKRPCEIENSEELFLNGLHLEQYKHMTYEARDYYLEGLKRDPDDIRCNTAMGRLELANGAFENAIVYFEHAIERMTLRNTHPADVEAFYLKGLAHKYLAQYEEAKKAFEKAIWLYGYRSAAYYELALIELRSKHYEKALANLDLSLATNQYHIKALDLKAAILRKLGNPKGAWELCCKVCSIDHLDLWAHIESLFALSEMGKAHEAHLLKTEIEETFRNNPEDRLDIVCEYLHAGFYQDAAAVLQDSCEQYPLAYYYLGYIAEMEGSANSGRYLSEAEKMSGLCFPSRLEDIAVLKHAICTLHEAPMANYYLGCLFYDRFRYDEAIKCWENTIHTLPDYANAYRNLGIAYFDKRHDARSARICMERAFELKKSDARILYELQQLLKNMSVSNEERMVLYQSNYQTMLLRDDCYLDYITLCCMKGDYKEAIEMASSRTFHIYEGGEGKITRQHAWMHVLYGNLLAKTEPSAAENIYKNGLIIPKTYGEAKSIFAQESHIYYYLAELFTKSGRSIEAQKAYIEAAVYKSTVSELSLFRALALQRLHQFSEAQSILAEMIELGDYKLQNSDLYAYFGVGSPTPMPFEYDIRKINQMEGYILKAYAYLGLGMQSEALTNAQNARALYPYDFRLYAFDQIKDDILHN